MYLIKPPPASCTAPRNITLLYLSYYIISKTNFKFLKMETCSQIAIPPLEHIFYKNTQSGFQEKRVQTFQLS